MVGNDRGEGRGPAFGHADSRSWAAALTRILRLPASRANYARCAGLSHWTPGPPERTMRTSTGTGRAMTLTVTHEMRDLLGNDIRDQFDQWMSSEHVAVELAADEKVVAVTVGEGHVVLDVEGDRGHRFVRCNVRSLPPARVIATVQALTGRENAAPEGAASGRAGWPTS